MKKREIVVFHSDQEDSTIQNQVDGFMKKNPEYIPINLSISECESTETLAVIFEIT